MRLSDRIGAREPLFSLIERSERSGSAVRCCQAFFPLTAPTCSFCVQGLRTLSSPSSLSVTSSSLPTVRPSLFRPLFLFSTQTSTLRGPQEVAFLQRSSTGSASCYLSEHLTKSVFFPLLSVSPTLAGPSRPLGAAAARPFR